MSLSFGREAARPRPAPVTSVEPKRRRPWERRYVFVLVVLDTVAVALAAAVAYIVRFGFDDAGPVAATSLPYWLVAVLAVPAWLVVMAVSAGYDPRAFGVGSEEYRRVLVAGLRFVALVAILFYAFRIEVARGFVSALVILATAYTLVLRYRTRKWLHQRRVGGWGMRQVLVVGTTGAATELVRHLWRTPYAGYSVVGACIPGPPSTLAVDETLIPVRGEPSDVLEALRHTGADALAVAGDSALEPGDLRTLAWQLEGSGVDLIVAPSVTDVAGPRISIRPVAGLPLLHVEEPRLSGAARVFKECFDRAAAGLALVVLLPVLLAIGAMVRRSSPGPALFCQERLGRNGRPFAIRKFRTMCDTAEEELATLFHRNDHDGILFKIRDDPRCTPVGRRLRRFSLDELPQLWNVVAGQMSLVGPRPPLPSEAELYGDDVRRRLLVKPGLTGLWQVSGRADLPWEEAVRLDLYYVDNWSPALDFLILWKTVNAVLRGRGAY